MLYRRLGRQISARADFERVLRERYDAPMATDADMLALIDSAFADCLKPARFHPHVCDECDEHDALLQERGRVWLTMEDDGKPSWDPVTGVTPEGFAYLMPALARLTLGPPHDTWGWYGPQLFFHLAYDGARNARWRYCTSDQRVAVVGLLRHIVDTRAALVQAQMATHDLYHAIDAWDVPPD